MSAADHGLPALGYVVDGIELARGLRAALAAPLRAHGEIAGWEADDHGIAVEWNDPRGHVRCARAALLVLADGGEPGHGRRDHPGRRDGSGALGMQRDYGQQAIVCSIRSSLPHDGTAYERFTAEGPLALLPFGAGYAVVWSLPTQRAGELAGCGDGAFAQALQQAFGHRRGRLSQPGIRLAYPLELRRSDTIRRRIVSIGNAAQTLHPVAGQGLNLGLRDAMALADQLAAAEGAIGSEAFVKRYYARRLADRAATIGVTDVLARVFTFDVPPAPQVRGLALAALDAFAPARNFFARRMILGARGR